MKAHDPDPSIQKEQLELKLGRQKKIQMIDGQQVEVMPSMSSENEEEEIDMMAVEGSDGQQYVVLEVIQLGDGDDQAMVVGDGTEEIVGQNIMPDHGKFYILHERNLDFLWSNTLWSMTIIRITKKFFWAYFFKVQTLKLFKFLTSWKPELKINFKIETNK